MSNLTDIVAGAFLIAGASFALVAAIVVARFPDLPNRRHAGTKPQPFLLRLIPTGLTLLPYPWRAGLLIAILIVFQMLTAPVSAHMVGRAAFRAGLVNRDERYVCEAPDEEPPAEGHTV